MRSNVSLSTIQPTESLPYQILKELQGHSQSPDIHKWGLGCALLLSCRSQFIMESKNNKQTQAHVGAIVVSTLLEKRAIKGYESRAKHKITLQSEVLIC